MSTQVATPKRRGTWVAITSILLGTVVMLSFGFWAFAGTFRDLGKKEVVETHDVAAAEQLVVDAKMAYVRVNFDGAGETATVTASAETDQEALPLNLESDGETLRISVEGERSGFMWGGPSSGGFTWSGDGWGIPLNVTITYPESYIDHVALEANVDAGSVEIGAPLASLDATLASATLDAVGAKELKVESQTGAVNLAGHYDHVEVNSNAAAIQLHGEVRGSGSITSDIGVASVTLEGIMPATFTMFIDSGFGDLTLPAGTYQIARDGGVSFDEDINPNGGADTPKLSLTVWTGGIQVHAA